MIVMQCYFSNMEAYKTAKLCFQLQQKLKRDCNEWKIVYLLWKQSINKCAQFSAANVFYININTLFRIFGSLVTYIIMIIQFYY